MYVYLKAISLLMGYQNHVSLDYGLDPLAWGICELKKLAAHITYYSPCSCHAILSKLWELYVQKKITFRNRPSDKEVKAKSDPFILCLELSHSQQRDLPQLTSNIIVEFC